MLRYAPGHNPNGSMDDVAGVCNEAGNVMGLMPHPEHAVDPLTGSADGGRLFESLAMVPGVNCVRPPLRTGSSASPTRSTTASASAWGAIRTRSSWPCSR